MGVFELYVCKFHNPNYPHWVARYVIVHLPPALSSLFHAYSSTKLPDLMPLLLARGETLWDNEFSLVYKKNFALSTFLNHIWHDLLKVR